MRRAQTVFDEEVSKSFSLDLSDLSRDNWSLLPQVGDFLAEVRTRRYDTLTFARSLGEAEDVTLFHRQRKRNIAAYASEMKLSSRGRFFNEDDLVEYDVLDYSIDASFFPERGWLDGQARLRLRIKSFALGAITLRLAEEFTVQSITSNELGRLMFLRVRNQNSVVVNLPSPVSRDVLLTLNVAYAGRIQTQSIDQEGLTIDGQERGPQRRRHAVHSARTELVVQQSQRLVSAESGQRLCDRDDPLWRTRRVHGRGERRAGIGLADPRAREHRDPAASDLCLYRGRPGALSRRGGQQVLPRRFGDGGSRRRSPNQGAGDRERAARPVDRASQYRGARGRSQSASAGARPRDCRHGCRHPAPVLVVRRRHALRLHDGGDGRARSAGWPQPRLLRRPQQPAADHAVPVPQRPGGLLELSGVLHRARARPSVVGTGGRLEELSRAVAERRVRAVLRGALCQGAARRADVPRCAPPVPPLGDGSIGSGRGVSRVSPRPHQERQPGLSSARLQQRRRGAAHAAADRSATTPSSVA